MKKIMYIALCMGFLLNVDSAATIDFLDEDVRARDPIARDAYGAWNFFNDKLRLSGRSMNESVEEEVRVQMGNALTVVQLVGQRERRSLEERNKTAQKILRDYLAKWSDYVVCAGEAEEWTKAYPKIYLSSACATWVTLETAPRIYLPVGTTFTVSRLKKVLVGRQAPIEVLALDLQEEDRFRNGTVDDTLKQVHRLVERFSPSVATNSAVKEIHILVKDEADAVEKENVGWMPDFKRTMAQDFPTTAIRYPIKSTYPVNPHYWPFPVFN